MKDEQNPKKGTGLPLIDAARAIAFVIVLSALALPVTVMAEVSCPGFIDQEEVLTEVVTCPPGGNITMGVGGSLIMEGDGAVNCPQGGQIQALSGNVIKGGSLMGCEVLLAGDGGNLLESVKIQDALILIIAENNKVIGNKIIGSPEEAINIVGASGNLILENVIKRSTDGGIVISREAPTSENNVVVANKIYRSGGSGIELNEGADFNSVLFNLVLKSREIGIEVNEGATNNTINGNFALRSAAQFDLADFNFECDDNVWRDNKGKGNEACID